MNGIEHIRSCSANLSLDQAGVIAELCDRLEVAQHDVAELEKVVLHLANFCAYTNSVHADTAVVQLIRQLRREKSE